MNNIQRLIAALMCFAATAVPAGASDFTIALDPAADFVKDLRESTCGTGLGYAGTLLEFPADVTEWFFDKDRAATAAALRECGARLVMEWGALDRWQIAMAWTAAKTDAERDAIRARFGREGYLGDPAAWFSLRKEAGIKVILSLEQYRVWTDPAAGETTEDLATVSRTICDYLRWIIDNGFKDQVAGFELGCEPYWGHDPETYGRRWSEIIPAMKEVWPEVRLGLPLAEYRPDDPDIAAVRARCENIEWCQPGGEFSFSRLNQWSGRFIVAVSNRLDDISHVTYHFYGADAAYGCGPSGFARIKNFAKVYPEIAGKKVWITEWRERADEDNRCHQMFFSALWKAHWLLLCLSRPEIDGVNNHCLGSLAGGLYVSDGKTWRVQWDEHNNDWPDESGVGHPHFELGPSGPLFRLFNDALADHPVVLKHGTNESQGPDANPWFSAVYYANIGKVGPWLASGKDPAAKPRLFGATEWIAATDPERTSLAILLVNTMRTPWTASVDANGLVARGAPAIRIVSCPGDLVYDHEKPGEPKPWKLEERTGPLPASGPFEITVPPHSFMTFVVPAAPAAGVPEGSEAPEGP